MEQMTTLSIPHTRFKNLRTTMWITPLAIWSPWIVQLLTLEMLCKEKSRGLSHFDDFHFTFTWNMSSVKISWFFVWCFFQFCLMSIFVDLFDSSSSDQKSSHFYNHQQQLNSSTNNNLHSISLSLTPPQSQSASSTSNNSNHTFSMPSILNLSHRKQWNVDFSKCAGENSQNALSMCLLECVFIECEF